MNNKKEEILKQKEEAELKVQQYQHKIQLLENRKKHLEKKADRQRTHHLCNMGGAIQSISKEADSLSRVEFYSLMEQVFVYFVKCFSQKSERKIPNFRNGIFPYISRKHFHMIVVQSVA